ncbi:hypothetical protein P43SY_005117 [Pythium insidiosum]|uniref:Protein kinase domain-containing protein n=1 Tax=Pythium insidiosum TaxID=114742 RepID=A0AAD5LBG1_PYTIN|nr:hypothetical protein P43SY_005117 [Pythium insidiosum]
MTLWRALLLALSLVLLPMVEEVQGAVNVSSSAAYVKPEGFNQQTTSVVVVNPRCETVDVSLSKGKASVECKDTLGSKLDAFDGSVLDSVLVTLPRNSKVSIGDNDSPTLRELWINCTLCNNSNTLPLLSFDRSAFRSLPSLDALGFLSVNFARPTLKLDISATVTAVVAKSTNADDVSLELQPSSATPQLNLVNFYDTPFAKLPAVFYERRYSAPLKIYALWFLDKTDATRLDAKQYANAQFNLNATIFVKSSKPIFAGECTNDIASDIGSTKVCSSTPLPKDPQIGGGGSANSTGPVVISSKKSYKTEMFIAIAVAAVLALVALVLVFCLCRARRQSSSSQAAGAAAAVGGSDRLTQGHTQPLVSKIDVQDDDSIPTEGTYSAMTRRQTASSERMTSTHSRGSSGRPATRVTTYEVQVQVPRLNMRALQLGQKISQGAYGEIFHGLYEGQNVAVKRLSPHHRSDQQQVARFLQEAQLMASISHERIITFIGVAWDNPSDLHVVTEFMDGGDLRALLTRLDREGAATGFDRTKVKIANQMIEGLAYLHALRPQILHRDLKSRNVLLSSQLDAKLIDFGVSRERADATMTMGVGTLRWMAPEVMNGGRYGETADIFSFGVILSEIDTHKLPYGTKGREFSDATIITQVSSGQLSVDFTALADREIVQIARDCLAFHPDDRPTAAVVAMRMRSVWDRFTAQTSFSI